jgi:cellulose synthase/poly-beta-1,6-N-acetylglucosamine synthase-like glycosyltransferase
VMLSASSLVIDLILVGSGLLVVVPAAMLLFEVFASLGSDSTNEYTPAKSDSTSFVLLIPAHNEAASIEGIVRPLVESGNKVLVVADNCTDDTAKKAGFAGAKVVVRNDLNHRGKGYALDFGISALSVNPPAVVIIFDADCWIKVGTFQSLADYCRQKDRPIQSFYSMERFIPASSSQQIAAFAWTVKNYVRPLGLRNLGLPCQLMGTGMAFPWELIVQSKLASGEIVEDMQLGIDCVKGGKAPVFYPGVQVESRFPVNLDGLKSQRERWELGHLRMIGINCGPLILGGLFRANVKRFLFGLDLLIPPLSFLVILLGFAFVLGLGVWYVFNTTILLVASSVGISMLICACIIAWVRYGQNDLEKTTILTVPTHLLRKIPLYLRGLISKPKGWIRTRRDEE